MLTLFAQVALGALAGAQPGGVPEDQNVLFVLVDDAGITEYALYGVASDYPTTPNLDALAATGVTFENAWSNPVCSPSRAQVLTGRHAWRTGVGWALPVSDSLSYGELLLPEALDVGSGDRYAHAVVGKWHLSDFALYGPLAPNLHGFDYSNVREENLTSYYTWTNYENGAPSILDGYAPTQVVDATLDWVASVPEPWFAYVWFNSAHFPFHTPPPGTYTTDLSFVEPGVARPYFKAMLESLDYELGRLLAGLGEQRDRTTVIFMGDNGSPSATIAPPWNPQKAKGSTFEGGIHVPLVVNAGWIDQPGRTCDALVSTVDVYDTVLELAHAPLGSTGTTPLQSRSGLVVEYDPGIDTDGVSFVPYLLDANQAPLRETVFAEWFKQGDYKRVVRGDRYKLHRYLISGVQTERFHDLVLDPFETTDLLQLTLGPLQSAAYQTLKAELDATPLPQGY